MTEEQIVRIGKQLANRLNEIERRGRTCQDEIQRGELRKLYGAVRNARNEMRQALAAARALV